MRDVSEAITKRHNSEAILKFKIIITEVYSKHILKAVELYFIVCPSVVSLSFSF